MSFFGIIAFKVDKAFDYDQELETEIYKAVSSYGIDMKSKSLRPKIEFSILVIEFSVASVQFLIWKSPISVNTIVPRNQNY